MKLHGYFGDCAVIQAGEPLIIKGVCLPHSHVSIKIASAEKSFGFCCESDGSGKFSADCGTYPASFTEYEITASDGKESVTVRNVLFGDVFLALGQSNMELRLKYLSDFRKTISDYGRENFRFIDVENVRVAYNGKGIFGPTEPADDFRADFRWKCSSDANDSANTFGFSYIFCGEMSRRTGAPVAAVNLAVGGSTFANWLPRDIIEKNAVLKNIFSKNLPLDENGESETGSIYYEKVSALKGFAFKGAVWYLGESSAWDGYDSSAAIPAAMSELTALYRKDLRGGLPMTVMHIGMQSYGSLFVNYANENLGIACKETENLAECPLFDLSHEWIRPDGEEMYHPIHLVEKRGHAERAAMLFYENFIAKRKLACPEIESVKYSGGKAVCKVANADKLETKDGLPVYGFALAGKDGKYVTAKAEITKADEIEVYSPFVKKPELLTYGFFDYNNYCNVSCDSLPLLPYRSKTENADGLPYAVFNPAFFCRYGKFYENLFSAFGGGAGFRDSHTVSRLFGDKSAELSYSERGVTMRMKFCPQEACFVGISPEILISGVPHGLDRYDGIFMSLTAEKEMEFTGIHFRTCDGEQFYIVPQTDGAEMRNPRLDGGKKTEFFFSLGYAADRKEGTFPLSREKRRLIAAMQITFRNHMPENAVTIHEITCYYADGTEKQNRNRQSNSKEKMYRYGK